MKKLLKRVGMVILASAFIVTASFCVTETNVEAETTILTCPDILVKGFQMKTNPSLSEGVCFRTICNAPNIGQTIQVSGQNYTVTGLGTIYAKDMNQSGDHSSNVLDKSYTQIIPETFGEAWKTDETGYKYIGEKGYRNRVVTFGYVATANGIGALGQDNKVGYTRTLTNMDRFLMNSLWVRAFVEAEDTSGNPVIIYGEKVSKISVASISYKIYVEGSAPTEEGHKYLFDYILNKLPETSPYFLENREEYGWGGIIPPKVL